MADLKILYVPGKRPPQVATTDKWLHTIPDWRTEYPRCENPPCEDVPVFFESKQKREDEHA